MRKTILLIIMSAFMLSGCTSTSSDSDLKLSEDKVKQPAVESKIAQPTEKQKEIKAGTIPKLTDKQKKDVDEKLNTAVADLGEVLKSIEDVQDIDVTNIE